MLFIGNTNSFSHFRYNIETHIPPLPPEKRITFYFKLSPGTRPGIGRPAEVAGQPPGTATGDLGPPCGPVPRKCEQAGTRWRPPRQPLSWRPRRTDRHPGRCQSRCPNHRCPMTPAPRAGSSKSKHKQIIKQGPKKREIF